MEHVFAYASLTAEPGARPARLRGFRRQWGVAMDNAVDLPGYKFYVEPSGRRPAVCVAFLDIVEEAGASVPGALVPVDPARLPLLDRRERNYERRDVSDCFEAGRVWTYTGRPGGRERLRRALDQGTAVVQRAYLELCGVPESPPCPVVDLVRRDLP